MMNESFEARLRIILATKGMSQADLAQRLDVPASTLNGWVRGRYPAPDGLRGLALRIESALGLNVGEMGSWS